MLKNSLNFWHHKNQRFLLVSEKEVIFSNYVEKELKDIGISEFEIHSFLRMFKN